VVYVGCGGRGNELADILAEFTATAVELRASFLYLLLIIIFSPNSFFFCFSFYLIFTFLQGTHHEVIKRTCIVGNTSDMPMAVREPSLHTGITMAEYFRDQGYYSRNFVNLSFLPNIFHHRYNSTVMLDSTSCWTEGLFVISYRLPNYMRGISNYPTYLEARLAAIYGRAGKVLLFKQIKTTFLLTPLFFVGTMHWQFWQEWLTEHCDFY
jgi:V-type H+-transporting ATPase subunit A